MTADRWLAPQIRQLARFTIPDHHAYYPHISAWLATGEPARDALRYRLTQAPTTMALDIEADGLGAASFVLKCATLAWADGSGETVGVYLDPLRNDEDRRLLRETLDHAEAIVLHNASYDVPPLYQHGVISRDAIGKIHDTAVYARMAYPDHFTRKNLESLATGPLVDFPKAEMTMAEVFRANGLTISEGYRQFDGDRPLYRLGAMADTVATLRLLRPLQAATWSRLVEGHPFGPRGVDSAGALDLMEREQRVNRVMMRRSARGLAVDTDYLHRYEEQHAKELTAARDDLANAGLDPDAGNLGYLLVSKLEELGQLPASWPRTGTGRLRATKDDMEKLGDLGHPLASSARRVSELNKVTGYLDKVTEMVRVTGRVHPQVSILGASATGRMSYSLPELQQFPADARPIIVSDSGLTSVDWSQIEPVIMANCAQDSDYLAGFNTGAADLYAPVQAAAGVERKVAKVLLLAVMYGRGATSTAAQLGVGADEATGLINAMLNGMPVTRDFISRIRGIGEDYGLITTAAGRILPIPTDPRDGRPMAYKGVNYFCVTPDTLILTDDLRHIRADEIQVGDGVVGFDEYSQDSRGRGTGKRFFRHATVTNADVTYKESVEIRTSDGKVTTCSDDHRWLVRRPGRQPRLAWVESKDLTPDMQLLSLGTWDTADTRDGGLMRTIGTLRPDRPERFIARARDLYDGAELHTTRMMEGTPHVVSVTPVGKRKVLAIGTTTRTLVANGYLSHNCQGSAYDVLADTIIRLDDAGLGDSIHLALHDELVVDTEAAQAVRQIMETPPAFLGKWTDLSQVVFRTDANDMGRTWLYV